MSDLHDAIHNALLSGHLTEARGLKTLELMFKQHVLIRKHDAEIKAKLKEMSLLELRLKELRAKHMFDSQYEAISSKIRRIDEYLHKLTCSSLSGTEARNNARREARSNTTLDVVANAALEHE